MATPAVASGAACGLGFVLNATAAATRTLSNLLGTNATDPFLCVPCDLAPLGTLCDGVDAVACPAGAYCPTASARIHCPSRRVCRKGVYAPQECFMGGSISCDGVGLGEPQNYVLSALVLAAAFTALWLLVHVTLLLIERRRQRSSDRRFAAYADDALRLTRTRRYALRWRLRAVAAQQRAAEGKGANVRSVPVLPDAKNAELLVPAEPDAEEFRGRTTSVSSTYRAMASLVERDLRDRGGDALGESMELTVFVNKFAGKEDEPASYAGPQDMYQKSTNGSAGDAEHEAAEERGLYMFVLNSSIDTVVRCLRNEPTSCIAAAIEAFCAPASKARAFSHALRRQELDERPLSVNLEGVSVAANRAAAARLRADGIGRAVVQDVTCRMRGGRITAVMGPSGCGKTTLLKALAACGEGQQIVAGAVYAEGVRRPVLCPFPESAYMPQESVLYPDLTAEESVRYARLLTRGPYMVRPSDDPDAPPCDKTDELVSEVLDVLGLGEIRGRVVGSEDGSSGGRSAVSGGQRRRIVLAMEIVKRSPLILLDEPTSGLDSTSTLRVMRALRDLANNGTTVVAVVHQPGHRAFKMVDDLVLLTAQGTLAYAGRADRVTEYFESIGYVRPAGASVPEFALDVAVGMARRKDGDAPDGPALAGRILSAKWRRSSLGRSSTNERSGLLISESLLRSASGRFCDLELSALASTIHAGEAVVIDPLPSTRDSRRARKELALRSGVGGYNKEGGDTAAEVARISARQFSVVFQRTLLQLVRGRRMLLVDGLLMVIMALVIVLIYGDVEPFGHSSQHSALGLTLGLTGVISGLRVFGNDAHIFRKERAAGVAPVPYMLGKVAGSSPMLLISPLMLSLGYCVMTSPRGPWSEYFSAFFLTQWAAMAVGIFLSVILPRRLALPLGVLYILIAFLCNSVTQRQRDLEDHLGGFGVLLSRVSLLSYGAHAITLSEYLRYPPFYGNHTSEALYEFGFAVDPRFPLYVSHGDFVPGGPEWQWQCVALFVFGLVVNVCACVAIVIVSSELLRTFAHLKVVLVRRGVSSKRRQSQHSSTRRSSRHSMRRGSQEVAGAGVETIVARPSDLADVAGVSVVLTDTGC